MPFIGRSNFKRLQSECIQYDFIYMYIYVNGKIKTKKLKVGTSSRMIGLWVAFIFSFVVFYISHQGIPTKLAIIKKQIITSVDKDV